MSDGEIIRSLAKALKCPVVYTVGTSGCKKCGGSGFVPMPWWKKMRAHYIRRISWKDIGTETYCNRCKSNTLMFWPNNKPVAPDQGKC